MKELSQARREELVETAFSVRERMRNSCFREDYPTTADEVEKLLGYIMLTVPPEERAAARDFLRPIVSPASVLGTNPYHIFMPGDDGETVDADTERAEIAVPPGYEELAEALHEALMQSAAGKGDERHADGRPFMRQPIMEITRAQGLGFPMGQAAKKVGEAAGMLRRQEPASARAELLGAIVYLAAAVLAIEEGLR